MCSPSTAQMKCHLWLASVLSLLMISYIIGNSIYIIVLSFIYVFPLFTIKVFVDLGVTSYGILNNIALFVAISRGSRWANSKYIVLGHFSVMTWILISMLCAIIVYMRYQYDGNSEKSAAVVNLIVAIVLLLIALLNYAVIIPFYRRILNESPEMCSASTPEKVTSTTDPNDFNLSLSAVLSIMICSWLIAHNLAVIFCGVVNIKSYLDFVVAVVGIINSHALFLVSIRLTSWPKSKCIVIHCAVMGYIFGSMIVQIILSVFYFNDDKFFVMNVILAVFILSIVLFNIAALNAYYKGSRNERVSSGMASCKPQPCVPHC